MLATKEAAREARQAWSVVSCCVAFQAESAEARAMLEIKEFIEHAEKRLPSQAAVDRDRARKRVKKDFPKKGDPWPAKAEE